MADWLMEYEVVSSVFVSDGHMISAFIIQIY